ncbi:hypothetical protein FXO38_17994 [Capsicum annuum]|nr:hypothetical protein FXO38_17994 [Capsicum annuum]
MQQLHSLILASESNVYKFYSLWKKDVKEVVMESSDPPCDFDSSCFRQSVQGWMSYIRHKDCQFFLFNLLSGKKINLPSVETIPSVVRVIRNSQSGWAESLVLDHSPEPQTPQRCSEDLDLISDVVLSSSPMDDDCIVDFMNDHLMNLQYLKDGIGNCAFFVSKKQSFVLSTTELPELRPGFIFFADDKYEWKYNFGGHDIGIYDYKEDSIIGKLESISPANSWFIPDVDAPDVDADFWCGLINFSLSFSCGFFGF